MTVNVPKEPWLDFFHWSMLLLLLSCFSRVQPVWPHRRQPTRLPRPWDSPGKNTGVGCHFLLQCMKVKIEKWKWSRSVMSNSQGPHGLQPTRLLCPWDFPGKSTGVGCLQNSTDECTNDEARRNVCKEKKSRVSNKNWMRPKATTNSERHNLLQRSH